MDRFHLKPVMDNPHSDRVRRIADLSRSKTRKKTGRFLVEGPQTVREAVHFASDFVTDLYYDAAAGEDPVLGKIISEAQKKILYCHPCSSQVMEAISKDCQGIGALVRTEAVTGGLAPDASSFAALTSLADSVKSPGPAETAGHPARPLFLACWQLRDPGNAGTIIRVADAAGCPALILVDDCVDVTNPKVVRSTAGSLFHLPIVTLSTDDFFAEAAQLGLPVCAADAYGTDQVEAIPLPDLMDSLKSSSQPLCILFGNEARGLDDSLINRCQSAVRIPLYGKAESLNVAMSASIIAYSLAMS